MENNGDGGIISVCVCVCVFHDLMYDVYGI